MSDRADLPLAGTLVVAIEQAVSAPLASRHLGDLGARVIKIETAAGDFARDYDEHVHGLATFFVWLNRGKESVVLDVRSPGGRAALDALLGRADVFIQNLGPGAAERIGCSATQLHERYPRIVACDLSGFGAGGPFSHKRAYDLVMQAETGSVSITGTPDAPAKPGVAVADIAAGMYVYSTALAALYARERTGRGAAVQISMFDAMAEWMSYSLYFTGMTGLPHLPYGVGHHAIVPYGAFATSDGHQVVLGCQNDGEWGRFASAVLGRPDLATHPDYLGLPNRVARRNEVHGMVADTIGRLTFAAATAALDGAGIANGRLNTPADLLTHPQLVERDRWREIDSPVGKLPALAPVPVVSGWDLPMGPIPGLGEHTEAVLAELGLTPGGEPA